MNSKNGSRLDILKKQKFDMRILTACLCVLALAGTSFPAIATDALTDAELTALYKQVENTNNAIDEEFRIHVDPNDVSVNEALPAEWWNILLLGTDTGGKLNYGRTDAMFILSVHTETGEIKLTSLIRDMWVSIPGMRMPNRINAANSFGGPYLAIKTVNTVFEQNIQHYCSINFSGLEKFVDRIGGVSLEITAAEARLIGAQFQEGSTKLNGEQALEYARIRKLDSVFGRNQRQRNLLTGLAEKVLNTMDITEILITITDMLLYMDTNLSFSDLINLTQLFIMNKNCEINLLNLPLEDEYHYGSSNGKGYIYFDPEAVKQELYAFIYEQ